MRFTAAHELGHHLLEAARRDPEYRTHLAGPSVRLLGRVAPGSEDEEQLCDIIAGAILLPASEVLRLDSDEERHKIDLARLLVLAQAAGASPAATFIRMQQLTGYDGLLASCQRRGAGWRALSLTGVASPLDAPATVAPLPSVPAAPGRWAVLWRTRVEHEVEAQARRYAARLLLLIDANAVRRR